MAQTPQTTHFDLNHIAIYGFTEPNNAKSIDAKRTSGQYGRISSDQFGAVYVTTFANIQAFDIAIGNTAAAYTAGNCLGTIESCDSVNRGNGFGAVLETVNVIFTENIAAASLPDIDVWLFRRASNFIGTNSFTNRAFPVIDPLNLVNLAGSVPIRTASGHWRQLKTTGGNVQHSVATVNPFLSLTTNNDTDESTDLGVLLVTQTGFTPAAADAFRLQLVIRKG